MSVREADTGRRCGYGVTEEGSDYSAALPLVGCATEEEARHVIVRYGRLAYLDTWSEGNYLLSVSEWDGTVGGLYAAGVRIAEELGEPSPDS